LSISIAKEAFVGQRRRTFLCVAIVFSLAGCGYRNSGHDYSAIDDEAMQRAQHEGRTPDQAAHDYLPVRIDNYFKGMDGVVVPPQGFAYELLHDAADVPPAVTLKDPIDDHNGWQILGRNTWMMWVGGNDGFWDWLSTTYGFIDLLKLLEVPRDQRFAYGGLINEPGMERRGPDRFGLDLDVPTDPEVAAWRLQYLRRVFHLDGTCGVVPYDSGQSYAVTTGSYPGTGSGYHNAGYEKDGVLYSGFGRWDSGSPKIPPPEVYGLSSGVIGLRLFPNPNFDANACRKWKTATYRDDPNGNADLVRPYRVGMSCAFCHASWHPLNPPTQMEKPEWANISGNIGAQYLRPRIAFGNLLKKDNFIYHLLDSQPPGTIDTSLIASDNVNNPNTMNAVFNLPQRAVVAFRNVREEQSSASAPWPSLWRNPKETRPDAAPYDPSAKGDRVPKSVADVFDRVRLGEELTSGIPGEVHRRVSRILLDGADSIGAWGALARVYLNIGTNWEQWNTLHAPVVGFRKQKPFTIANAERHSVYWMATELRVPALREYFLEVTPPMPLLASKDATDRADVKRLASATPQERHRYVDISKLERGRKVFANNCITCHSSIQPTAADLEKEGATPAMPGGRVEGRQEELDSAPAGQFWDRDPGKWLTNPAYVRWAEKAVERADFWRDNYLSTDQRIAINLVQTNACRAMATNAMNGHMWENFASESYRSMPSVGGIAFFNPYKGEHGEDDEFYPRHAVSGAPQGGGGPGFYRVPTLVSIWATAPFLHNNSLGLFNNDPSVNGRLDSFDDSIRKLLSPEKRLESSSYDDATPERLRADHGLIWRTTTDSYIVMPGSYIPGAVSSWLPFLGWVGYGLGWVARLSPWARSLPSVALVVLAILLFLRTDRLNVLRVVAYALVLFALGVGTVVYFFNGGFGGIRIGPIPKGVPVNLIANANPEAGFLNLLKAAVTARNALGEVASQRPDQQRLHELLRTKLAPALINVSKCPDLIMDHGHAYDWFKRMSDADKDALIELLKTF